MSECKSKKVIYKIKNNQIESVFAFNNGDFLLFEKNNKATLYDIESLIPKITLDIYLRKYFFYLTEDEFALYIYNQYKIYKFKNNRTEYSEIQKLYLNEYEQGFKLMRISNGDILFFKYFTGGIIRSTIISVYKRIENNSSNNSNNSYIYQKQDQYNIHDCDGLIEINNKELIGYRKTLASELLKLTTFYNHNYKKKIENIIKMEIKNHIKRMYFLTEIYRYNNKLICAGCFILYIIDPNYLELETTIKFKRTINEILIRPKGNFFILACEDKKDENEILPENVPYHFIQNIVLDEKNELIKNEELDITGKDGILCSSISFFNYPNNGLITIIDNELIIYDDYN